MKKIWNKIKMWFLTTVILSIYNKHVAPLIKPKGTICHPEHIMVLELKNLTDQPQKVELLNPVKMLVVGDNPYVEIKNGLYFNDPIAGYALAIYELLYCTFVVKSIRISSAELTDKNEIFIFVEDNVYKTGVRRSRCFTIKKDSYQAQTDIIEQGEIDITITPTTGIIVPLDANSEMTVVLRMIKK